MELKLHRRPPGDDVSTFGASEPAEGETSEFVHTYPTDQSAAKPCGRIHRSDLVVSMNAQVSQRSHVRFLALAAGGLLSIAADRSISHRNPTRRTVVYAAGLMGAAVVYPISHLGRTADSSVLIREWIAVLATAAMYVGASILPAQGAARLTAGGWLAHAIFDQGHDRGASSRLPQWYPALCAGFDVGVAALLCVSNAPVPSRNHRVAAESGPAR